MVGGYFEKNPMTNKIKKFLYTLEHLIPDGYDEIPTFALYHPLLSGGYNIYYLNHFIYSISTCNYAHCTSFVTLVCT